MPGQFVLDLLRQRESSTASTDRGIPSISAVPLALSTQARPSGHSWSRNAAWYRVPAVLACRYSCLPSNADQRPSDPRVMFANNTWVCSCGSPARDVRWRNAAATNPPPGSRFRPSFPAADLPGLPLRIAQRLPDRRVMRTADQNGQLLVAQGEQQRYRLRRGERQVQPRQPVRAARTHSNDFPVAGSRPSSTARSPSAPT